MISAGLFTILLHHPESPVLNFIPSEFVRRMLTGIAMGSTAVMLVFSPLGKRSGAHFNPAVTLTFWRLGKVKNWDAMFYIIAQFIGAIAGVFAVTLFVREALSHPTVNYAATLPGMQGVIVAFIAEFVIAFVLMSVVLRVSNTPHIARYTGLFAGALVATYITLESPLSGMRETVVEDARFTRASDVTLNNHRSIDRLKILQRGAHRSYQSYAIATLANVWF